MLRISSFLAFIFFYMCASHAVEQPIIPQVQPILQQPHATPSKFKTLQKKDFFVKMRAGYHNLSVEKSPNPSQKQDSKAIGEMSLSYFAFDMFAVEMSAGYTPYFLDNKLHGV